MDQMTKWFKQHQPKRILDIATGAGNFIQLVKSLYDGFESIIGIDTLEYAIKSASKNFQDDDRISFAQMDGNDTDFEDQSFDLITLSNSLHHLEFPTKTFAEMKRLLAPGGHIIISEMISNDLDEQQISHLKMHHFAAEIDRFLGDVHNETYSEQEIKDLLSNMPFKLVEDWALTYERRQENTDEEIAWLKSTLDRLVNRVSDETKKQEFQAKANEIKDYIDHHGFDGATTLIVVMEG